MPQASIALAALNLLVVIVALVALEARRRRSTASRLLGRYVIVNTRRPDDQSIRGWVRAELPNGALELSRAVYLEPGDDGAVAQVDAGDVWIPAESVSWVQLDVPAPSA